MYRSPTALYQLFILIAILYPCELSCKTYFTLTFMSVYKFTHCVETDNMAICYNMLL